MAGQRNSVGTRGGAGKPARTKSKTQTIKSQGKKPITFKPGGLHESVGVPQGQKIPAATVAAAAAGKFGEKAAAQARFAQNVLTGPKSGSKKSTTKKRGASRGSSKKAS